MNSQEAARPSVGGREAFQVGRHTRWARQKLKASPGEPRPEEVNDVLPERPEPEEMVGENDKETDEYAVCGAILPGCGAAESNGNDGLGQVQEKVLNGDPEDEPDDEDEGIGKNCSEEGGRSAGTLEDVGKGGKCREGGERRSGLGRDKGEGCEEELDDGEDGWRELEEDDEDGEDVSQRTGREDGGGDGEHRGHGHGVLGGSIGVDAAGSSRGGHVVKGAGGGRVEGIQRGIRAGAGSLVGAARGRSSGGTVGKPTRRRGGSGGRRGAGRVLRHLVVYIAGERRRRGLGPPIGVAVELRNALLLCDPLPRLRDSTLMSLVVQGRVPFSLRYHRRRWAGGRSASHVDSAAGTGRARLEDREPRCGRESSAGWWWCLVREAGVGQAPGKVKKGTLRYGTLGTKSNVGTAATGTRASGAGGPMLRLCSDACRPSPSALTVPWVSAFWSTRRVHGPSSSAHKARRTSSSLPRCSAVKPSARQDSPLRRLARPFHRLLAVADHARRLGPELVRSPSAAPMGHGWPA